MSLFGLRSKKINHDYSKQKNKVVLTAPATKAQQKRAPKPVQPKPTAAWSYEAAYLAEARRILDGNSIFNNYRGSKQKKKDKRNLTAPATNAQQKSAPKYVQPKPAAAWSYEAAYLAEARRILDGNSIFNKYRDSKQKKKKNKRNLTAPATKAQQKRAPKPVQPKPAAAQSAESDYLAEARRILDGNSIFNKYRNR